MPSITFTIASEKYGDFEKAILEVSPVPTDDDGVPLFTNGAWIKECIRRIIKKRYQQGKKSLARKTAVVDSDIIN